ncbi:MAG TPA: amidase [Candidatus Dormibacteraeota bacterium]|nr:amidase [Candidatus Dormibacteraeota bacterium]
MDLDDARARISERSDLHAFISVSEETGRGTVVAVKDLVDVRGMVTTAGGILLPDVAAAGDAPVINRIREAGCVVVGKTNLHEFAYGVTSINPHFGNVLNPHDTSRVAGGSSGGSAVAVAARMCDWAIGSDTGGSIRIPSALCGVTGFKPAFGSIDVGGVIPLSSSLDTLGPIAPDIESTVRAYTAMSGEQVILQSLTAPRLAIPRGWVTDLDEATSAAWALVSDGLPEIAFVGRDAAFQVGLTILLYEAAQFHRRWAETSPEKYGDDVLRLIRRGLEVTAAEYESALEERHRFEEAAHESMAGVDALLLPATAIVAPRVDAGPEVREPLSRFTRPFNTTHQPVAVLPAPVDGLPVGIQVAGKTNGDTLRAAAWLEEEWRRRAA